MVRNHTSKDWGIFFQHMPKKRRVYLEVGAKRSQHNAMAGELLPPTAQSHITEGVVEPQAVKALQDCVGVPGLHKQVVLGALGGRRRDSSRSTGVLLDLEDGVHSGRQEQRDADGNYFSHI